MLAKCPDQRYHRTLGEAPKDGKGDCYVSPFVLHGYYAKYLDIFFQVLPSDQLLVVDYAAFAVDPAAVMDEVARHLGLDPRPSANFSGFDTSLVFNTRENRGTHARDYRGKARARRPFFRGPSRPRRPIGVAPTSTSHRSGMTGAHARRPHLRTRRSH